MTIEKHGNKWRIVEMYNGVRYRMSLDYKPTKKEAEQLIAEKIKSGDVSTNHGDTFEDAANKYIKLKSNILSPWTISGYQKIMRSLSPEFMKTRLSDIDGLKVQKEINSYTTSHASKTTHNAHGFISAVLKTYKPNLALHTTLPQKDKYESYMPTDEEIKQILDHVKGTKYEIPYRLGCWGLRRGEICALTSADLDGLILTINKAKVYDTKNKEYIIRPMPKTTESNRKIQIDEVTAELIRAMDGEIYSGDIHRLYKHLSEIQKKLGISHFRFHDFRAYFATKSSEEGMPEEQILSIGGWASTNIMKRRYRKAREEKNKEMCNLYTSKVFGEAL